MCSVNKQTNKQNKTNAASPQIGADSYTCPEKLEHALTLCLCMCAFYFEIIKCRNAIEYERNTEYMDANATATATHCCIFLYILCTQCDSPSNKSSELLCFALFCLFTHVFTLIEEIDDVVCKQIHVHWNVANHVGPRCTHMHTVGSTYMQRLWLWMHMCACTLGGQAVRLQIANATYKLCSCLINTICRFPITFILLYLCGRCCAHVENRFHHPLFFFKFSFSIYDFCLWLEPCNCCKAHCN